VAIRGEATDGNRYVFDAAQAGAAAIVSELPRPWSREWASVYAGQEVTPREIASRVAWVRVRDARQALATIGANFYRKPAESLTLAGITGTNGKTTTGFLLDSVLRAAGASSGLLGTILYRTPRGAQPAKNTTPESLDLQRFLAEVRDAGGTHTVLEVSSHALAMDRVWGCAFGVAVFTNLTRDHMDYHKTFEHYFASKRKLFEGTGAGAPAVGVVNVDDAYGRELAGLAKRTITYGLGSEADVRARKFASTFFGLEATVETPAGLIELRSPLVGTPNLSNVLATVAAGIGLRLSAEAIRAGIEQLQAVPGRFERVDAGQPFLVVVDYAHTDDALRNLLKTARELGPSSRILTLFGCGGDRDRTKRPLMGEAAGRMSDLVVLTCDNPRTEDPLRIINDVVVGLQKTDVRYLVEPDRRRAIELALANAQPGDIVLLAGKGHETAQILRDRTLPFDDREEAREVLKGLGYGK
jgi:UDP-N-acetylmuramoyl-L-alanyl-D-glutamate--2,6-diaminopimelate ligase